MFRVCMSRFGLNFYYNHTQTKYLGLVKVGSWNHFVLVVYRVDFSAFGLVRVGFKIELVFVWSSKTLKTQL